jgi:2-polyprenyl-6-methoxyphenol hydroxylase-like FAD-dependent oxidoreductase
MSIKTGIAVIGAGVVGLAFGLKMVSKNDIQIHYVEWG